MRERRPERYGAVTFFETIPSRFMAQARPRVAMKPGRSLGRGSLTRCLAQALRSGPLTRRNLFASAFSLALPSDQSLL